MVESLGSWLGRKNSSWGTLRVFCGPHVHFFQVLKDCKHLFQVKDLSCFRETSAPLAADGPRGARAPISLDLVVPDQAPVFFFYSTKPAEITPRTGPRDKTGICLWLLGRLEE